MYLFIIYIIVFQKTIDPRKINYIYVRTACLCLEKILNFLLKYLLDMKHSEPKLFTSSHGLWGKKRFLSREVRFTTAPEVSDVTQCWNASVMISVDGYGISAIPFHDAWEKASHKEENHIVEENKMTIPCTQGGWLFNKLSTQGIMFCWEVSGFLFNLIAVLRKHSILWLSKSNHSN